MSVISLEILQSGSSGGGCPRGGGGEPPRVSQKYSTIPANRHLILEESLRRCTIHSRSVRAQKRNSCAYPAHSPKYSLPNVRILRSSFSDGIFMPGGEAR